MNDDIPPLTEESPSGFKMDAFLPLMLLSISVIILIASQCSVAGLHQDELKKDQAELQKTMAREDDSIAKIDSVLQRQEQTVTQSKQVQAGLAKLAGDLLAAAETDGTARAIAEKFGIKQGAAAPSASPSPTPGL